MAPKIKDLRNRPNTENRFVYQNFVLFFPHQLSPLHLVSLYVKLLRTTPLQQQQVICFNVFIYLFKFYLK